MKKQLIMLAAFFVAGISIVSAQPGGGRMTVEERVARVHFKLDSAFKLDAAKLVQADSAFAVFYRGQQQKMMELMSGGERPDREAMQAAMKPMTDARDEKLKGILTAAQFKTWKDDIEPSMNRRGPGGGPGGGRPQN